MEWRIGQRQDLQVICHCWKIVLELVRTLSGEDFAKHAEWSQSLVDKCCSLPCVEEQDAAGHAVTSQRVLIIQSLSLFI